LGAYMSFINIHGLIDKIAVGLGAKFIPKYFRESIHSQGFDEHLQNVSLELPEVKAEGDYELSAATLVGELQAAFRLVQWRGERCSSVIYHHGANEIPFDYGFRRIFSLKRGDIPLNLFLVRAPFHRSMKEFQQGIRAFANFIAMLAVSVHLIEQLVQYNKKHSAGQILVAGTSLGGFITNLHHINYNSADFYTPLLAGTAMDDAFLHSVYSRAVAKHAKENSAAISSVLNFEEEFKAADNSNVFPLLARFDEIIRYELQKASYGNRPVVTINKGHTTGALSYEYLRQHILKFLPANVGIKT